MKKEAPRRRSSSLSVALLWENLGWFDFRWKDEFVEREESVCACVSFFFASVLILTRSHAGRKEGVKKKKKTVKRIFPVSSGSSLNMFSKLSCARRWLMWGDHTEPDSIPLPLTSSPWLWLQTKTPVYFDRHSRCQFNIAKTFRSLDCEETMPLIAF